MAFWDASLTQLRELWGRLTITQRSVLIAVAVSLAIAFSLLVLWAGSPEYAVLFTRLNPDDASQVVEKLQADGTPYRLENGGRTVLVPADGVYETRLRLAGEGIPQGGVVGFEIFDKSGFGMTDFAQKVNYSRALEGELTRTIRRMEGVEGARVHLVLPERRLFEDEAEPASASVVLQIASGRRLTPKQVQGVVYLVASSVEGLQADRITVVDTQGNVLYQSQGDDAGTLAGNQLEFKRAFEADTERRVREMLEKVLGPGAAVVQVAAEFDFDRIEETSEAYDPDGTVVRSEERLSETTTGAAAPSGVPGVESNVGEGNRPETSASNGTSTRETETVNYEISKVVKRIERTPGALDRITVAVAVDGSYRETGENGEKEFVPRSPGELEQLRSLVEKGVGANPDRGDAVEVRSIPFRPVEGTVEAQVLWGPGLLGTLAKYGAVVLVALVLVLGVARPLLRVLARPGRVGELEGPVTVAELERKIKGEEESFELDETTPSDTLKRETLKKRIKELVHTEPEVAAQLLRSWMTEE